MVLADYGKLHVSSANYTVVQPGSVDAAVGKWRDALARGAALRIRGSGHGLSGASLPRTGETLFLTRELNHYRVEAPGLLVVGSGAVLWDIRDFAAANGMRLTVYNGGWAGPSVGGFVCAGGLGLRVPPSKRENPGSGDRGCRSTAPELVSLSETYGGLWAQVARLTMIDGCGSVHDILPGDEIFPWMFASMGQFGLVLEVTLNMQRNQNHGSDLPVGSSGRIPVSNPLNREETDTLPPATGIDWVYWFTALVPVAEEDAAWKVIGNWSRAHRDALRPTGGWVGPLQDDGPIGFRYLVLRKAPTPPMLYPRDEDFVTMGVMAVCSGIGTDPGEVALMRAEREFVAQIADRGWSLYCQAENLTRSLDFQAYLGPERWARFCELKNRFDPDDRINAGEVRPSASPPPLSSRLMRRLAARVRRSVGLS